MSLIKSGSKIREWFASITRVRGNMLQVVATLFVVFYSSLSFGDTVVTADFRPRPPEMVISENSEVSGPIKDLFEKIISDVGGRVEWRIRPFKRSLHEAQHADKPDFIVRMSFNEKRSKYLLPILFGYKKMDVYFAVRKGDEGLIKNYDDLYDHNVFVKSGSNYFRKFDQDTKMQRTGVLDDEALARMFVAGRIRVMPVIDVESFMIEYRKALEALDGDDELAFTEYVYHQNRARYMTLSRNSIYAKNHQKAGSFYQRVLKSTHSNRGCRKEADHYVYDTNMDYVRKSYERHGIVKMTPEPFDCNAYFGQILKIVSIFSN